MNTTSILTIALGVSMDALAVSIAIGISLPTLQRRHLLRVAWVFGAFQAAMPIIGWLAGTRAKFLDAYSHWIVFALLTLIGGKMIYESFFPEADRLKKDPTRGWLLILLGVATSIDALAVGFSMALLDVVIWQPALWIGLITATLCMVGLRFGQRLGQRAERYADLVGGSVLILIGVKILLDRLLA